jgi:hypothetical protein
MQPAFRKQQNRQILKTAAPATTRLKSGASKLINEAF